MTIKYRYAIDRRTFLRGTGVAIALPMLDAMIPSSAVADSPDGPKLVILYVPNGGYTKPQQWVPSATGAQFEFPEILRPLAPYRESLSVISGLWNRGGEQEMDGFGDHARAAATYLTGLRVNKQTGAVGKSIDQMIADRVSAMTKLKSLEITMEDTYFEDSGYPSICKNLCWIDEKTPRVAIADPATVFDMLFGTANAGSGTMASAPDPTLTRRSILDLAGSDAKALASKLCANDKEKLDQYLTAVRELELRLARTEATKPSCDGSITFQAPRDSSYVERLHTQMDLITLALACNATRVVTFSFAQELSLMDFGQVLGASGPWHSLSHYNTMPGGAEAYLKIPKWMVEHFAYFLGLMSNKKGSDGKSLLENSLVTFGAGISDPDNHLDTDLPLILAGRGGGHEPGQHVRFTNNEALANFWLAIAGFMGCPAITRLGTYGTAALSLPKR